MNRLIIRHLPPDSPSLVWLEVSGALDRDTVTQPCTSRWSCSARGGHHLLLDLADVTWCDAASLHTVPGIRQAASHIGGSLRITAASDSVRTAPDNTGSEDWSPIVPRHPRKPEGAKRGPGILRPEPALRACPDERAPAI